MKIIVDGEFDISDETGQKVHAVKGDVFYCECFILRGKGGNWDGLGGSWVCWLSWANVDG